VINHNPDPRKTQDPRTDPLTQYEREFVEYLRTDMANELAVRPWTKSMDIGVDGLSRLLAIIDAHAEVPFKVGDRISIATYRTGIIEEIEPTARGIDSYIVRMLDNKVRAQFFADDLTRLPDAQDAPAETTAQAVAAGEPQSEIDRLETLFWKLWNQQEVNPMGTLADWMRTVDTPATPPAPEAAKPVKPSMKDRCLACAELNTPAGCAVEYRKSLSGVAYVKQNKMSVPHPVTRRALCIYLHECAHIHLNHTGKKPRHVEELEAEQWAIARMREAGIAVPRKSTQRAK
jgi:hypothetical protein